MPSWYKKNMEACQWNNSNKKQIPTKIGFLKTQNAKNNVKIWKSFSEVGKSLSTKINHPLPLTDILLNINSKNSLFLAPIDAYKIQLLIKNLKMKSNSSPNDIPNFWK